MLFEASSSEFNLEDAAFVGSGKHKLKFEL
jgi:hypothetical protein